MNICVAPSKNLSKEVDHRYLIDLYEIAHHRISRKYFPHQPDRLGLSADYL